MSLDGAGETRTEREGLAFEISGLHKWFGNFQVLADINLKVRNGERVVICGPSGSGKSTLIRCINALEDYQRGEVKVEGVPLTHNLKRIDESIDHIRVGAATALYDAIYLASRSLDHRKGRKVMVLISVGGWGRTRGGPGRGPGPGPDARRAPGSGRGIGAAAGWSARPKPARQRR